MEEKDLKLILDHCWRSALESLIDWRKNNPNEDFKSELLFNKYYDSLKIKTVKIIHEIEGFETN